MLECKKDVDAPLILQSYIMALVLRTVRDFRGACEVTHEVYIPFPGQERYLSQDSYPVALGILRRHSLGMSSVFTFPSYYTVLISALLGTMFRPFIAYECLCRIGPI